MPPRSQFEFIISGLDNAEARDHLNRIAVFLDIPMIDAGTSGYNGQTQGYLRFRNECRFCRKIQNQEQRQSFAVCTIRNKPERNIHCIHFALNVFTQMFGKEEKLTSLGEILLQLGQSKNNGFDICVMIHNYLFSMELPDDAGVAKLQFTKTASQLNFRKIEEEESEYEGTFPAEKYSEIFITVLITKLHQQNHAFDKDRFTDVLLIWSLTNLRILNFRGAPGSKLKLMGFYECKDHSGKIIPAIASTNAIAAAFEIVNLIKYLKAEIKCFPYTCIRGYDPTEKLYSLQPYPPLNSCEICSPNNLYYVIETDLSATTFGQLQTFLAKQINPELLKQDMRVRGFNVIRNTRPWHVNKPKKLNFNKQLLNDSAHGIQHLIIKYSKSQGSEHSYKIMVLNSLSQISILRGPSEYQFQLLKSLKGESSCKQSQREEEEGIEVVEDEEID